MPADLLNGLRQSEKWVGPNGPITGRVRGLLRESRFGEGAIGAFQKIASMVKIGGVAACAHICLKGASAHHKPEWRHFEKSMT